MLSVIQERPATLGLAFAVLCATGCGTDDRPLEASEKPMREASVPTATPARPKPQPLSAGNRQLFRLPGMHTLVTDDGLRLMAQVVEDGVAMRTTPLGNATPGRFRRFVPPYYVFDVHPHDGEPQAYLLGRSPDTTTTKAWCPASAVALWPTRVALMPCADRRLPITVHETRTPLIDLLQGKPTSQDPLARLAPGVRPPRFPLPVARRETFTVGDVVHELLEVHFIGKPTAPGPTLSAAEKKTIERNLVTCNLMFVVDTTGSMQPYWDATVKLIPQLATELRAHANGSIRLRVGVVAFRDHDEGSQYVVKHFDLDENHGKLVERLDGMQAAAGGNAPEATYDAIHAALTRSTWAGGKLATSIAIVISDSRAHEPGEAGNPERISRDALVAAARQRGVHLCALAVGERDAHEERQQAWQQFQDLTGRTGGKLASIDSAREIVAHVTSLLDERARTMQVRRDVFLSGSDGADARSIANALDLELAEVTAVFEFLKAAGVDMGTASSSQLMFGRGWVLPELHGERLLERRVLIAQSELDVLLGSLNLMCTDLQQTFLRSMHAEAGRARAPSLDTHALARIVPDTTVPLNVYLASRGVPCGPNSILRCSREDIDRMEPEQAMKMRRRVIQEVIPALVDARADERLWTFRDELDVWGFISEEILP